MTGQETVIGVLGATADAHPARPALRHSEAEGWTNAPAISDPKIRAP